MPWTPKKPLLALLLFAAAIVGILGLLELQVAPTLDELEGPPPSDFAQVAIRTKTGWYLEIRPDGSAKCGIGSGLDFVTVLPGTYDFPTLYRKLRRIVQPEGNGREFESVSFLGVDSRLASSQYTKDTSTLRPLFETAMRQGKSEGPGARLKDLWKTEPLF